LVIAELVVTSVCVIWERKLIPENSMVRFNAAIASVGRSMNQIKISVAYQGGGSQTAFTASAIKALIECQEEKELKQAERDFKAV
jgi:hypothetical protein